jgi:hypothetical protein
MIARREEVDPVVCAVIAESWAVVTPAECTEAVALVVTVSIVPAFRKL